jgi:hypothetical protein
MEARHRLGFAGFSKLVNGVLSDNGGMFIKVTTNSSE